jgi:NADH-quinone oxidoreductase subunit L
VTVPVLWIIPIFPLVGALALMAVGRRASKSAVAVIGAGSVGASAVAATVLAIIRGRGPIAERLWSWFGPVGFDLRLDALSLVMVLVVANVALLILVYAIQYMREDEAYARFFAWMDLFVASMLTLVLAGDFVVLYLGWEGVGLASFLLIGFWYRDPQNVRAARKAFLLTRIGDAALMIGLLVLYDAFGTLRIERVLERAPMVWSPGAPLAVLAAACLLGGAVGKSAQIPLQTWLPDAMAGPTPTSALIHAATMVTAGVYLIARTFPLFELAPAVRTAVAIIGALTLLLGGRRALVERDLKRILAYSTMSQVGYMFLALGSGAYAAAIFHLMTHAFFKALLFLVAGVVISAAHHEQDIFALGGLARSLPLPYRAFVIGAASLAGFPLITAGFYSKEWILSGAFARSPLLYAAGLAGVLLTALYIFRAAFIVFLGEPRDVRDPSHAPMRVPIVVLAVLSLISGFMEVPRAFGAITLFSSIVSPVLPAAPDVLSPALESVLSLITASATLSGIYLAYRWFGPYARHSRMEARVLAFASRGPSFDRIYMLSVVRPFLFLTHALASDPIGRVYSAIAELASRANRALSWTQSGKLRWYLTALAAGAIVLLAVGLLP